MEQDYQWRSKARVVALTNLVILVLALFMSVIIKDTTVDEDSFVTQVFQNKDFQNKDEDVLMMVALFVFSVAILLLVLGFCGAVKLLRATDKGRFPQEALALAQFWQIVNLIYILLCSLELFMFRSFWKVLVQLILLGAAFTFWYIVSRFMDELKQAISIMKAQAQEEAQDVVVTSTVEPKTNDDSMI